MLSVRRGSVQAYAVSAAEKTFDALFAGGCVAFSLWSHYGSKRDAILFACCELFVIFLIWFSAWRNRDEITLSDIIGDESDIEDSKLVDRSVAFTGNVGVIALFIGIAFLTMFVTGLLSYRESDASVSVAIAAFGIVIFLILLFVPAMLTIRAGRHEVLRKIEGNLQLKYPQESPCSCLLVDAQFSDTDTNSWQGAWLTVDGHSLRLLGELDNMRADFTSLQKMHLGASMTIGDPLIRIEYTDGSLNRVLLLKVLDRRRRSLPRGQKQLLKYLKDQVSTYYPAMIRS
jgi:hypothetical protein